jgi:hypothetical protein
VFGGATWRCQLADHVGGPAWRCHPWRSWGGAETHQHTSMRGSEGSRRGEVVTGSWRSLTGGATWRSQLAESVGGPGWRTRLAERVGGAGWRCCLWRCGFEPRLISEIRCEDRKVPSGESWSPAVGALWLALFDWQSNLAVSVGGATWRTCLADVVGGVACGGASLSPD